MGGPNEARRAARRDGTDADGMDADGLDADGLEFAGNVVRFSSAALDHRSHGA